MDETYWGEPATVQETELVETQQDIALQCAITPTNN